MARILFAWEFGSGLGHLTRMMPIAAGLHALGHDIIVAVPEPKAAEPVMKKNFADWPDVPGVTVRPGVKWSAPNDPDIRKKPTHVLADVLRLFHYHDIQLLSEMTRRWREVLEETAPDLIVADFAPTLRLAHKGECPFVMTGNGYTVPPAGRLMPPIKPWQEALHPFSRAQEAEVWRAINRVREANEGKAVDYVSDLLNGDRSFVCTIPEFDPYRPHRSEPTLIPFNVPRIDQHPHLKERRGKPIFVYLPGNHVALKAVMQAVTELGHPVHAYISNADPAAVARLAGQNVRFHRSPLNFADTLWQFTIIIHHAGLATAYAAVMAGTPQLLLPVNLEHSITARGVETFGAGRILPFNEAPEPEAIVRALKAFGSSQQLWDATYKAAEAVANRPVDGGVQVVIDGCVELLHARAKASEPSGEGIAEAADAV